MNKKSLEEIIENWFRINRPDIEDFDGINQNLIQTVIDNLPSDIQNLSYEASLVVVRVFLNENYKSNLFLNLEEIIDEEDEIRQYFQPLKEIGFLYKTELGSIMNFINEKGIDVNDTDLLKEELTKYIKEKEIVQ